MIEVNQIIEYLSSFIDYIENFIPESKERDNVISRLKESVFWLTYMEDNNESR